MKWKAPATEPSPDCRPLHEVHATAKDDQGHAWSNGEYAARGCLLVAENSAIGSHPTLPPASGQPPHRFSGSGQGLPDRMTARRGWKKFFFSPGSGNVSGLPARPQSRPGKLRPTNTSEKLARHLREVLPAAPHQATSASHAAQTRDIPPVSLPSRPCVPHLAYWRHRHDTGTKPSGGYE